MPPLAALSGDDKEPFMTALAKELHCRREDILFFELSVLDYPQWLEPLRGVLPFCPTPA